MTGFFTSGLLFFLAFVAILPGVGQRLIGRWVPEETDPLERFVICAAGGVVGVALLCLILAWLGWLRFSILAIVGVGAFALCHRAILVEWQRLGREIIVLPRGPWIVVLLTAWIFLWFGFHFLLCWGPTLDTDVQIYHLAEPKLWALTGQMTSKVYNPYMSFTGAMHALYAGAMALHSDRLAQLLNWLITLLFATLLFAMARRDHEGDNHLGGLIAAALLLSLSDVAWQVFNCRVDVTLAFFIVLGVRGVFRFVETGERRWLVLAMIFSSFAVGVKQLGLGILPMLALVLLFGPMTKQLRSRAMFSLMFLIGATALALPWYTKNWVLLGNPLWPNFASLLGTKHLPLEVANGWVGINRHFVSIARTLPNLLSWPLVATFWPPQFQSSHIGPLFLAFLPWALWQKRALRQTWLVLAFCLLYGGVVFWISPMTRFYLAPLALFSVSLGLLAGSPDQKPLGFSLFLPSLLVWLMTSSANVWMKAPDRLRPVIQQFQSSAGVQMIPESASPYVGMIQFINGTLRAGDKLLFLDSRPYYLEVEYEPEGFLLYEVPRQRRAQESLAQTLSRCRITHVLLPANRETTQKDPTWGPLLQSGEITILFSDNSGALAQITTVPGQKTSP